MDTNVGQCKICECDIDILVGSDDLENLVCDDCLEIVKESGLAMSGIDLSGDINFIGSKEQWSKYDRLLKKGEQ